MIDKSRDIINRASLTYEGKIHLGFVYGMDRSSKTGRKMVEDALHFAPYLEYLLGGKADWGLLRSKPNVYLVAADSMLSPGEVENHFAGLDAHFRDCLSDEGLHYLGARPPSIFRRVATPGYVNPAMAAASFITEEVSVSQLGVKDRLKKRLLEFPSIGIFLGHRVTEISARPDGIAVQCEKEDGSRASFSSDMVFNCMWESRVHFDRMMGIDEGGEQSIRLKYGLVVKADDFLRSLDSFTIVHGPYGNVVVNSNDDRVFCSWYPSCMKGMMGYGKIPESWDRACDGGISSSLTAELREDNFLAFRRIVPQLTPFEVFDVTAGLILAEGSKDISERDSSFHSRSEFPIRRSGDFYSVSTSKYTSAPRNTMLVERMLFS
ncbi:MAG: hypothetical protein ACRD2R_00960 [Terriglobales bacterium]